MLLLRIIGKQLTTLTNQLFTLRASIIRGGQLWQVYFFRIFGLGGITDLGNVKQRVKRYRKTIRKVLANIGRQKKIYG